jgi:purine-nucleoside phosphorylase
MNDISTKLENTKYYIRAKTQAIPKVGIILGSGLGKLAENIKEEAAFNYASLPNFFPSTVEGHKGELILGKWENCEIAVLNGRTHYYEGYSFEEITYPVYLLKLLGIEQLIITSAVGSMKKKFRDRKSVV